jgi:hypothetical protein
MISNKRHNNIAAYVAKHKLEPPMYDWNPGLLGIPHEILGLIFDKLAFQFPGSVQDTKAWNRSQLQLKGVMLQHPHSLNALATTCKGLRDCVEDYCKHLLKVHLKSECSKFLKSVYNTAISPDTSASSLESFRRQWLDEIQKK